MMWGIWNAEGSRLESVMIRTDDEEFWLLGEDSIHVHRVLDFDNLLYSIKTQGFIIDRVL